MRLAGWRGLRGGSGDDGRAAAARVAYLIPDLMRAPLGSGSLRRGDRLPRSSGVPPRPQDFRGFARLVASAPAGSSGQGCFG